MTKYYDLEFNLRESKTEPSNYFPDDKTWYESANTETVEKRSLTFSSISR